MATIIVEDGSIVTGANSYISEAELTTYATDRGVTISGANDALIIQSMDTLEQSSFKGDISTEDQPLQWPRLNVVIDGYYVDSDEIPQLLKDSQAEIALAVDAGNNPLSPVPRATKKTKVGSIEVEFMDGASNTVKSPAINNKLNKLTKSGGGLSVKAVRA